MSSHKYSKLVLGSFLLLLLSFLIHSCKDSTTVVGANNGTTSGNVTMSVTSPKNGDTLKVASTTTIQWSSNSTSTVKIEFSTDGATWIVLADNVANNGAYLWYPIPNLPTSQGMIRVTTDDKAASGVNTGFFNVVNTGTKALALSKPNGGEVLYVNESFRVEWVSSGITSIKIELSLNNGTDWNPVVLTFPADSSYYVWNPIPNSPSTQCLLRITDVSDPTVTDKSKSVFSITLPQPVKSISMIAPNGGEQWLVGTTNEIRWASTNIDSVKLEYTLDGGADWNTIAANVPSNGLYNWLVPNVAFRSDNCRIRVSDAKEGIPYTISQGTFSMYSTKVLKWLIPNGKPYNTQILASDTTITWFSSGIDYVNIEYTIDNGQQWNPVVSNLHSTGAYFWHVPLDPPSTLARLRVTDSSDPTITDMSDTTFNINVFITPGFSIKILTPIGNNTFSPSSGMNISWKGIDIISSVKIEYSADNGKSWNTIANNIPNARKQVNNYIWNGIPQGIKGNILIRLSDSKGRYSDKSGKININ
jgi:hypothetical protein